MLGGLTPIGVTFVVVVLIAMTVGVSTAVYYAWIAPCIDRQRLRRALRRYHQEKSEQAHMTSSESETEDDPEKAQSCYSIAKDEELLNEKLAPPAPAYLFPKRLRFSTATQDGVWWFV
ncbi:hypothetical protein NM688_g2269 [Phlebia brevispora]|uniref:Uncharacterized protein n=1 Tax=Phlebia brevispora TaxID=194682 RepID=A0ACC1T922_9APHY|nr:hypothetical protein NM688_g2269 [Phlebia brevispora]